MWMGLLPGLDAQLEFSVSEMGNAKVEDRGLGEHAYKTQTTAGVADWSAPGAVPLAVADMFGDWIGEEIWRPCGSVAEEGDLSAFLALLRKQDTFSEPSPQPFP